jgi:hypothetical protein
MKFSAAPKIASAGRVGGMKPITHMPSAPKIHPAASFKTKVRLPDSGSIGADPAPFSSTAGKF